MITIPMQLQDSEYRFYLVRKNQKLPLELLWNTKRCYQFNDPKLQNHILKGGNYGVVTGYGNLIVLDFDNKEFYDSVKNQLPQTFTVLSATKRMPHLYYHLKAEMIKKKGIDIDSKRVCDIQAYHNGVVAPESKVNERSYDVLLPCQIVTIAKQSLEDIFKVKLQYVNPNITEGFAITQAASPSPELVTLAIKQLTLAKVERTHQRLWKCYKHDMNGIGNLTVMPNGRLYCFHCQTLWLSAQQYIDDYLIYKESKRIVLNEP